jgi:hypothetical protein
MQNLNLFEIFIGLLNQSGINYFTTGSVASIVYGEPRLTHDIDLVISLSKTQLDQLIDLFPPGEFYVPPKEILITEMNRDSRGHFNVIHNKTGFKADFYMTGKDQLAIWAMSNVKKIEFDQIYINVAPIEYVIVKKLEFYKEGKSDKHITDTIGMINNSYDMINTEILEKYCDSESLIIYKELVNKAGK